jgi:hypothetical protein
MKRFVFWTGIISVFAGAAFQFPVFAAYLKPSAQPGMLLRVFGRGQRQGEPRKASRLIRDGTTGVF